MTATEARRIVLSAIASAAPAASATDAAPAVAGASSLARHDARFHPNGYKPGDRCSYREQLAKEDDADLLAAAEEKEMAEAAARKPTSMPSFSTPAKMPPLPKRKPATPAIIHGADADSLLDMDRNATGRKYGPYKVGNIAIASDGRSIAAVRSDGDGLPDCDTQTLLDYLPDKGATAKLAGSSSWKTSPVCTVGIDNLQRAVSNAHWDPQGVGYLFADLSDPSAPAVRVGLSNRPEPGETLLGGISKKRMESFIKVLGAAGENAVSIDTTPTQTTTGALLAFNGVHGHGACLTTVVNPLDACRAADPANCPYHRTGKYAWGAESLAPKDAIDYLGEIGNASATDFTLSAPGEISTNLILPREIVSMLKADKSLAGWMLHTPRGDYMMGGKAGSKTSPKKPSAPAQAPAASTTPSPSAASAAGKAKPAAKGRQVPLPQAAAAAIGALLSKLGNGPAADILKKAYAFPKGAAAAAPVAASTTPAPKTKAAPKPASKPKARAGDGPNPPLPTGSPADFPSAGTGPGQFDFSKFSTWDSAGSGSTKPRKVKVGGRLYFVKKAGVNPSYTPEAAANEVNANTALRLAGFHAPDSKLYTDPTGTYCVTLGADLSGGTLAPKIGTPSVDRQLRDAYPLMALLYNTDILENDDNAFIDSSGRAVFLDNGSTFGYSAQGTRDPKRKFGFDYDNRTDPDPKSPTGIMALADFHGNGASLWRKALGSTPADREENALRAAAKYRMGDLARDYIGRGLVPKPAQAAFQKYADGIDALSAKYRAASSAADSMDAQPSARPASLRLHRVLGDITGIGCDAIVNAANPALLGGGGVDGAIHRAAGPALLEACRALPEVSPGVRCPTGESRVTEAYDLPCCYVIHTVGPVYRGGGEGEAQALASCYRGALELARECGCTSVAFPAISTGAYGYPAAEAAEIAEREVLSYLEEDPDMDVTLVTYAA